MEFLITHAAEAAVGGTGEEYLGVQTRGNPHSGCSKVPCSGPLHDIRPHPQCSGRDVTEPIVDQNKREAAHYQCAIVTSGTAFKHDILLLSKVRPAQHPDIWRTAEGLCDAVVGVASAVRLSPATIMARGRRRVYAICIDATGQLASTVRDGYAVSTGSMGGTCASSYAQAMPQLMVTAMLTNVMG